MVLRTVEAALGAEPQPAPQAPDADFDRHHLRALTDQLARKVEQLEATERQLAERVRELAEADLRKNEFLAMLAHELRNPLAPIRTALEVMRQRGDDRRESTQRLQSLIERQVRHLTRLIDDLLDVARITHGTIELHKERVGLAEVVDHAVESVRPLIDAHRHHLTVALPSEPVYLEADPARLEQSLANLLHNAAKFTEPGGHIWLTAERQPPAAATSAKGDTGGIGLRVRDTGIGMTPDTLARAFDLFAQAERSPDRAHGGALRWCADWLRCTGAASRPTATAWVRGASLWCGCPRWATLARPAPRRQVRPKQRGSARASWSWMIIETRPTAAQRC